MYAMPLCAGLYISDIMPDDFDSISQTIKSYFNTVENKPALFDEWIKNVVYDKANHEIRVVSDVNADPGEYGPLLNKCVTVIAAQHPTTTLHGFYDLYNGNYGASCCIFTLTGGELEWSNEDDVDMEYAASVLIDVAAENGYLFDGNPSLVRIIAFVRELADSGSEEAQEALDNFNFFSC